jgi:hypothetical protein
MGVSALAVGQEISNSSSVQKLQSVRNILLMQKTPNLSYPIACQNKISGGTNASSHFRGTRTSENSQSIVNPDDPYPDEPWDGSFYNPLDNWSDWQSYFYEGNDISSVLCRGNRRCLVQCNSFCSQRTDQYFEQCMAEAIGKPTPAERESAAMWCVGQAVAYRTGCGGLCVQ